MKAYSLDLRQHVVAAVERGEGTVAEVAELFGVGTTFIKKMLRLHRAGADLAPKPHGGGHTPRLDEKQLAKLKAHVKAHNDLTLNELREHLATAEQISLSRATVGRAIRQMDMPRKKNAARQ
jgi:transposase